MTNGEKVEEKKSVNQNRPEKIVEGSVKTTSLFRTPVFHILIIVILGILIYSNTFNVTFVFDDIDSIVNNPAIRYVRHMTDLRTPLFAARSASFVLDLPVQISYTALEYRLLADHEAPK